jgi:hypothetical protein
METSKDLPDASKTMARLRRKETAATGPASSTPALPGCDPRPLHDVVYFCCDFTARDRSADTSTCLRGPKFRFPRTTIPDPRQRWQCFGSLRDTCCLYGDSSSLYCARLRPKRVLFAMAERS